MNRWLIVFLLFLIYTSSTISTNCLPTFFVDIKADFGWTSGQVSKPSSFYFIFIAIFAPIVGLLMNKFKPKTLMIFGIVLAFFSEMALTMFTNYAQFFGIYVALSIAITFSGLIPSMVIISNWFKEDKGIAVGIFLLGSSFGGIIYPQFAKILIPMYGWRVALSGVAILGLLLSIVPLFFVKNSPDGQIFNTKTQKSGFDFKALEEVLKTPVFYFMLAITAAFWFCGFGILSHQRLYFTEHKFNLNDATNLSSLFFVFSIIGKLFFGYISDRLNKVNILIFCTLLLILGIYALQNIDKSVSYGYLYAIAYGFGYSGAFAMIQLTVADYYKGDSFSTILGFVNSFDSLGGFFGVMLLGVFHDADKNYNSGIQVLFYVGVIALLFTIALKIVEKKTIAKKAI
jgi:MFS family permease